MDFIGSSSIDVSQYYSGLKEIVERTRQRKKWQEISRSLLKTMQHIVLLASREKATDIKDAVDKMRIVKKKIIFNNWLMKQKWKKIIRKLMSKYNKIALLEYYKKYISKRMSTYQIKWQQMSRKALQNEKERKKASAYKDLLNARKIKKYFSIWLLNKSHCNSVYRSQWISFYKRTKRIKTNKTLLKEKERIDYLKTWEYLSNKLCKYNKSEMLKNANQHNYYQNKWIKMINEVTKRNRMLRLRNTTTTKPKWTSMISRIVSLKQRKLLIKTQRRYVIKEEWKSIYERYTVLSKERIIEEGKKEIKKLQQEEFETTMKKHSFDIWINRYTRKSATRKLVKEMYRDSISNYSIANQNQCAMMIQDVFRGKMEIKKRKEWKRSIEPLFFQWKDSILFRKMFKDSIPNLVQEFEYPEYSIEFEPLNPRIPELSPAFDTIGALCYGFIQQEKRRENEKLEKEANEIANKFVETFDIDSVLQGLCSVSISESIQPPKKEEIVIPDNAFDSIFNDLFDDSLSSVTTKVNISALVSFSKHTTVAKENREELNVDGIEAPLREIFENDFGNVMNNLCECSISPLNNYKAQEHERGEEKDLIASMCEDILDIGLIFSNQSYKFPIDNFVYVK